MNHDEISLKISKMESKVQSAAQCGIKKFEKSAICGKDTTDFD